MELRGLSAGVLAQRVDLIRRDVELVAALVRDQQIVAFDTADGPFDHPLVLADAVLMMHDVVAGLEVLERAGALALGLASRAVSSSTTGEVALGDDGDLRVRQGAAAMQRGHGDAAARLQRRTRGDDREVETVVHQQVVEALRRAGAVGGDHHPEAASDQFDQTVGEARAVSGDRTPTGRLDERSVGRLGGGIDRPEGPGAVEQRVGVGVEAGERLVGIARPRGGKRAGEVVFFGDQIECSIAHPAWFDEDDLGGLGEDVGE